MLDAIDADAEVFAVHRGDVVAGKVSNFQTEPPIFTLRIPAGIITTQQIFFTRPEKAIPERGRLVKHKATGTYIRSSGNVDPEGKLLDDQGKAWEDDAWVDEDLERRKAEDEANRKAEQPPKPETR